MVYNGPQPVEKRENPRKNWDVQLIINPVDTHILFGMGPKYFFGRVQGEKFNPTVAVCKTGGS